MASYMNDDVWFCHMCGEHTNPNTTYKYIRCDETFGTPHDPYPEFETPMAQPDNLVTAFNQLDCGDPPVKPCQHFPNDANSRAKHLDCSICGVCDPIVPGPYDRRPPIKQLRSGVRCWYCEILKADPKVRNLGSPTAENGQFPFQTFHTPQIPKPPKKQVPRPTQSRMTARVDPRSDHQGEQSSERVPRAQAPPGTARAPTMRRDLPSPWAARPARRELPMRPRPTTRAPVAANDTARSTQARVSASRVQRPQRLNHAGRLQSPLVAGSQRTLNINVNVSTVTKSLNDMVINTGGEQMHTAGPGIQPERRKFQYYGGAPAPRARPARPRYSTIDEDDEEDQDQT